ncbi:MAG: hypothetical protein E7559_07715 [Ruminococcaceae bacterium]|nr:hypothetical protein [Oscillospiraceae bacterium]
MSTFGMLATVLFLTLMGGLVLFEYSGNSDLPVARWLLAGLYILVFVEFLILTFEFPAYLIDGAIFASMGFKWLANVMFAILAAIFAFIIGMIVVRIKWRKFTSPTPAKLIVTGVLLIALLAGTELWNGAYSFDDMEEFNNVKKAMQPYDNHFFPTKYIKHKSMMYEQECIAAYPFDMTTAAGKLPFAYKGDIFLVEDETGDSEWFFYPFNWKRYEAVDAVSFNDSEYVAQPTEKLPPVSAADASATDATAQQVAQG